MNLFLEKFVGEEGDVTFNLTTAGNIAIIVIMLLVLLISSYFTNKDNKRKLSVKQLTYSAACLALAFVLSNIKLMKAPMGGSVTPLSMFIVTYIGYLYGPRVGLSASIGYGFLQLIADPYIISVPQLICDYILAFGALGIAGFFCNQKYGMVKGYIAGILGRYFFSVLSGVIFFASYAPENQSPLVYSLLYNISYIGIEGVISIIIILIPSTYSTLRQVKTMANEKSVKKQVVAS